MDGNYKTFDDIDTARKWGLLHYKEWGKKQFNDMLQATNILNNSTFTTIMDRYCGYWYRQMNSYLRNCLSDGDAMFDRSVYNAQVAALIMSICSAPKIPENIIVYRFVGEEFPKNIINGEIYIEKGFMSTTLVSKTDVKTEYQSYPYLLKIAVDKNMVGAYVNAAVESMRPEEEILFPPECCLFITSKPYEHCGKIVYECKLNQPWLIY